MNDIEAMSVLQPNGRVIRFRLLFLFADGLEYPISGDINKLFLYSNFLPDVLELSISEVVTSEMSNS